MSQARDIIVFRCPECDEEMEIHPRRSGEYVQCVECGEDVQVPRQRRDVRKDDPGLSTSEYLLFGLLFLCVPIANVVVSSILYYLWKATQPRRANQINTLGFLVFGFHVILMVLVIALGVMLSPMQK